MLDHNNAKGMQWRTKRSGKSGAKYWFRNNVSVELLAVAFASARTWAKYSATTESQVLIKQNVMLDI